MSDRSDLSIVDALRKQVRFVQHNLPSLKAGRYRVEATQNLSDAGGHLPGDLPLESRDFGVTGPAFSINPNQIHAVFPPAQSTNEYGSTLPHVVLSNTTLPWIRSPYLMHREVGEGHYGPSNAPFDHDVAPWMTVLTVSPSDFDGSEPNRLIKSGTVLDLAPRTMQINGADGCAQGQMPATHYSQFSYLQSDSDIALDVGHTTTEPCKYIDLPVTLFRSIAPGLSDLEVMAHIREVDISAKAISSIQRHSPEASYALILGNRLPESFARPDPTVAPSGPPKGRNTCLLVSLERMEKALDQNGLTGFERVRLVVLHSWDFVSWFDTSADFKAQLTSLNGRAADTPDTPLPNPLLRLPDPPEMDGPAASAAAMLRDGYVPMNHVTRAAGPPNDTGVTPVQTVSWYRGPLIPFAKTKPLLSDAMSERSDAGKPIAYSADALLRFDPNLGIYDTSYAAAWTLGRTLSLADRSFSLALYRWRKSLSAQARSSTHASALMQGYVLPQTSKQTQSAQDLQNAVMEKLAALAQSRKTDP